MDNATTPLKSFVAGEQVLVESYNGKNLGVAYVNLRSLICARMIGHAQQRLDKALLVERISRALALRVALAEGVNGYRRINEAAMSLLCPDGYLLSGSCSMHLYREQLVDVLRGASVCLGRHLQIIEEGMQGPDHPVHPVMRETQYIKAIVSRVC